MTDSHGSYDGESTTDGGTGIGGLADADRTSRRNFLRAGVAAGAGATVLGASGLGSAQSHQVEKCELWDQIPVGNDNFALFDNQWNDKNADQCIWKNADGTYGYTFTDAGGSGFNYPEVFIGKRPWGEDTGVPEFMIERGNVDQLEMTVDAELDISGGEWDFAEEWWLMDGQPATSQPPTTHEIMMVLDWNRNHSHGGVENANVWTDKFGNEVDHWAYYEGGGGTSSPFHIFRVKGGMTSGSVDLKPIIDYLSENYGVRDDLMISGIELGNEYQNGTSGTVTYNQFDVTINGTTYTSGPDGGSGNTTTTTTTERTTTTTRFVESEDTPGRVGPNGNLPSDPDDDGLYEDVNGNTRQDIADAVDLFQHRNEVDAEFFDFNESGGMSIGDAVSLFRENT